VSARRRAARDCRGTRRESAGSLSRQRSFRRLRARRTCDRPRPGTRLWTSIDAGFRHRLTPPGTSATAGGRRISLGSRRLETIPGRSSGTGCHGFSGHATGVLLTTALRRCQRRGLGLTARPRVEASTCGYPESRGVRCQQAVSSLNACIATGHILCPLQSPRAALRNAGTDCRSPERLSSTNPRWGSAPEGDRHTAFWLPATYQPDGSCCLRRDEARGRVRSPSVVARSSTSRQ
jgi:hypothetical protein